MNGLLLVGVVGLVGWWAVVCFHGWLVNDWVLGWGSQVGWLMLVGSLVLVGIVMISFDGLVVYWTMSE